MVNAVYNYMFKLNNAVTSSKGAGTFLAKRIDARQKKNIENIEKIQTLDNELESSKTYFNENKEALGEQNAVVKKASVYDYVALTLVILIGIVGTFVVVAGKENILMIGAGMMFVSFGIGIGLYFGFVQKVQTQLKTSPPEIAEPFVSLSSQPYVEGGANQQLQYEVVFDQVSNFMENTIFIINTLRTYKTYGNMNASTRREVLFFEGVNQQLRNSTAKLRGALNISVFGILMHKYKMMFFCFLAFIIALTITLHAMAREHETVQQAIIVVSCVITFLAFIFFVIARNYLVRTNPGKRYWGGISQGKQYMLQ
jgi:disulfide bond formation protein DsbB